MLLKEQARAVGLIDAGILGKDIKNDYKLQWRNIGLPTKDKKEKLDNTGDME